VISCVTEQEPLDPIPEASETPSEDIQDSPTGLLNSLLTPIEEERPSEDVQEMAEALLMLSHGSTHQLPEASSPNVQGMSPVSTTTSEAQPASWFECLTAWYFG
jgi:hypothetical protein